MKFFFKSTLVVAGVFLSGNSLTLSQAARNHADRISSGAVVAPSSETPYKAKCSKCHGADGAGETSLGRMFGAPDFTDSGWWARHSSSGELIGVITRGKKNMPAFGKKLSRAQIAGLAAYVQKFKR